MSMEIGSTSAQLDALRLSDAVRQRLVNFSCDDQFARDPKLTEICRRLWQGAPETGGLLSELWVEGAYPAKRSESNLLSLAHSGKFDSDLCRILNDAGAMPSERWLYTHQKDAVLQAQEISETGERPAIVISAGTGSGKTECFLLPVLNDLFRNPARASGIKCLILYPMNALVNDQVDRLYGWLKGQSLVTLFHFTSETPENKRAADYDRVPNWDKCRFRTRQEARGLETRDGARAENGSIPDIVITNYSMLEYMLCRPQDAVFFSDDLRAIVLDEAHLYTGTLAAEITLLLRRLYARCGVDPSRVLQIATSATLGTGSADELRTFAGTLFSKDPARVHVIIGENDRVPFAAQQPPTDELTPAKINAVTWIERPLMVANVAGQVRLAESADDASRLAAQSKILTSMESSIRENRPAALLYQLLQHAPVIHRLGEVLWTQRRLPLSQLARQMWGETGTDAERATITLLQLAASARPNVDSYPLVPHRIHLLVRPTEGLSVCLNPDCSGPEERKLPPLGTINAGLAEKCQSCDAAMLLLYRCGNCGEWLLAGLLDQNRYRAATADVSVLHFFSVKATKSEDSVVMTLRTDTGERSGSGAAGLQVTRTSNCPRCGADSGEFRPFSSGAPLTLAILAETVLSELPKYPAVHNAFLPARGRRLLAFSDSRQEAARLGPRLTRQHETQLVRSAIVQSLSQRLAADPATLTYLREQIGELESRLRNADSPALRQMVNRQLEAARQQLEAQQAGGSMAEWAEAISRSSILAELLDAESGQDHVPSEEQPDGSVRTWSQQDWEKNWNRVRSNALAMLGREFIAPNWRAVSTETLGLGEVTYPGLDRVMIPHELLGRLPDGALRGGLRTCWNGLLHALCDTLRVEGVISFGNDEADRGYETAGTPVGRWSAKSEIGADLRRFVGQTPQQNRRRFVASVLGGLGLNDQSANELAREILIAVFDQFLSLAGPVGKSLTEAQLPWLERHERQSYDGSPVAAIRLVFRELGLRRPAELFGCEKTGHVWPRSVMGCAPEIGCRETLRPVSDESLDNDPRLGRFRQEYRESPVFKIGLWAEEHSAQLSPQQNRRLQDLFKAGIRNILSATTTLELGIDIGGLTAALLGNVPPGKANYLQRAGRAGRRADGSASVITFARPRPFDREVFRRFGVYLDRPLRKPLVFLDRERVVRRHFHAFLLGEFFRSLYGPDDRKGAMDAFGNMGKFCGKPWIPYWEKTTAPPSLPLAPPSLESRFRARLFELRDYGNDSVQTTAQRLFRDSAIEVQLFDWQKVVQTAIDAFTRAVQEWNNDYELLMQSWMEAVQSENKSQANAIRYQLKTLAELTVIESLADRQFLPSYGFPIGLQKLRVIAPDPANRVRVREEDQFRLERAGIIAVGEYVPGSQLLAGGKLITSRGLLKHWTGASLDNAPGLRGRFCQCENEHSYYWIAGETDNCPICGAQPRRSPEYLLFVKHGFTSAAWDPPKWSTDVERVGTTETLCITFRAKATDGGRIVDENFAGVAGLVADYRDDGELLVFNRGDNQTGFSVCLRCGYADSEPARTRGSGKMNLPTSFLRHAPIQSPRPWDVCWREGKVTPVLRNQIFAAREATDVLLLDLTKCLGQLASDVNLITTLAYAFQNSAAQLLELDTRELGVLVVPTGPAGTTRGAVIYDNVPGGAGHVRELMAQGTAWLNVARQVLFVDDDHDRRCESGCLDCLLSFDAQRAMANRPFSRRAALKCLDRLAGCG